MPRGSNGTISAKGIGTRKIVVEGLGFGLGIITSAEGESRRGRSFYPVVTTGSSFTMVLAFVSWEEREAFTKWLRRYEETVVDGSAESGVMTIRVPRYNFTRIAVHEGDLEYGEGVGDTKYVLSMPFVGASNPINLDLNKRMAGVSYFRGPKGDQESQYFYPAGRQVKGAESLDGTVFDPKASGGGFSPEDLGFSDRDLDQLGLEP